MCYNYVQIIGLQKSNTEGGRRLVLTETVHIAILKYILKYTARGIVC